MNDPSRTSPKLFVQRPTLAGAFTEGLGVARDNVFSTPSGPFTETFGIVASDLASSFTGTLPVAAVGFVPCCRAPGGTYAPAPRITAPYLRKFRTR